MCKYPQRPEKSVGFPKVGIADGCKLPGRCWESDPLEEQLTAKTSLQADLFCNTNCYFICYKDAFV